MIDLSGRPFIVQHADADTGPHPQVPNKFTPVYPASACNPCAVKQEFKPPSRDQHTGADVKTNKFTPQADSASKDDPPAAAGAKRKAEPQRMMKEYHHSGRTDHVDKWIRTTPHTPVPCDASQSCDIPLPVMQRDIKRQRMNKPNDFVLTAQPTQCWVGMYGMWQEPVANPETPPARTSAIVSSPAGSTLPTAPISGLGEVLATDTDVRGGNPPERLHPHVAREIFLDGRRKPAQLRKDHRETDIDWACHTRRSVSHGDAGAATSAARRAYCGGHTCSTGKKELWLSATATVQSPRAVIDCPPSADTGAVPADSAAEPMQTTKGVLHAAQQIAAPAPACVVTPACDTDIDTNRHHTTLATARSDDSLFCNLSLGDWGEQMAPALPLRLAVATKGRVSDRSVQVSQFSPPPTHPRSTTGTAARNSDLYPAGMAREDGEWGQFHLLDGPGHPGNRGVVAERWSNAPLDLSNPGDVARFGSKLPTGCSRTSSEALLAELGNHDHDRDVDADTATLTSSVRHASAGSMGTLLG